MPQQLENLLKICREELEKVTDDRVKKVILYVSPLERKICDITYDFNNEHETDIMPVVQSKDHFDYWRNADMFYRNVEKEGGVI